MFCLLRMKPHFRSTNIHLFYFAFYLEFNQAYGDSSFKDCKKASEELMTVIINKLEVHSLINSIVIAVQADENYSNVIYPLRGHKDFTL